MPFKVKTVKDGNNDFTEIGVSVRIRVPCPNAQGQPGYMTKSRYFGVKSNLFNNGLSSEEEKTFEAEIKKTILEQVDQWKTEMKAVFPNAIFSFE